MRSFKCLMVPVLMLVMMVGSVQAENETRQDCIDLRLLVIAAKKVTDARNFVRANADQKRGIEKVFAEISEDYAEEPWKGEGEDYFDEAVIIEVQAITKSNSADDKYQLALDNLAAGDIEFMKCDPDYELIYGLYFGPAKTQFEDSGNEFSESFFLNIKAYSFFKLANKMFLYVSA